MQKSVILYYFSGTGNARLIARQSKNFFEEQGFVVHLVRIKAGGIHSAHFEASYIGIISSVYGFGLPDIVDRFLWDFPQGRNQKSFVLTAIGHQETLNLGIIKIPIPPTEGVALIQAGAYLKRKNYQVLHGEALQMPNNWILPVSAPAEEEAQKIRDNGLAPLSKIVDNICNHQGKFSLIHPVLAVVLGTVHLGFSVIGRRFLGKTFVSTEKCTGCGWCEKHCPQQTIKMLNGRPDWRWDCQQCYRCINRCPEEAIEVSATSLLSLFLAPLVARKLFSLPSIKNRGFFSGICTEVIEFLFTFFCIWGIDQWRKKPSMSRFLPDWLFTSGRRRYKSKKIHTNCSGCNSEHTSTCSKK
jgi:ferredoxin